MTTVELPFPDPETIVVAGDWHGNTRWGVSVIQRLAPLGHRVIVHVGDFGVWPGFSGMKYLDTINEALESNDAWIVFVDGNHEDFDQIDAAHKEGNDIAFFRSRIIHLRRATRWIWHGKDWLAMGGAVSVDKQWRTPGKDWWPQETQTLEDLYRAQEGGQADFMVSHDVPSGVEIPGLSGPGTWPAAEIVASDRHRESLRQLVDVVQPLRIFHGHYHVRYDAVLKGRGYETVITGLNLDGVDDNVLVVPLV